MTAQKVYMPQEKNENGRKQTMKVAGKGNILEHTVIIKYMTISIPDVKVGPLFATRVACNLLLANIHM